MAGAKISLFQGITSFVPSEKFPWSKAVNALDHGDLRSTEYFQQLLDALVSYLVMPPPDTKDVPCQLPLFTKSGVNCSQHPTALAGVKRRVSTLTERKIKRCTGNDCRCSTSVEIPNAHQCTVTEPG